jgi:hypothetical protein
VEGFQIAVDIADDGPLHSSITCSWRAPNGIVRKP